MFYFYSVSVLYMSLRLKYQFENCKSINILSEIQLDCNSKTKSMILDRKLRKDMSSIFSCILSSYKEQQIVNLSKLIYRKIIREISNGNQISKKDDMFFIDSSHQISQNVENSFTQIFDSIGKKKPYVRTDNFKDKMKVIIALSMMCLIIFLPPIMVYAFNLFISQLQKETKKSMPIQVELFRLIDLIQYLLLTLVAQPLPYYFLIWFIMVVYIIKLEISVWSSELFETIELNLVILYELSFEPTGSSRRDEQLRLKNRKLDSCLYLPYFDMSSDSEAQLKNRLEFVKNTNEMEKIIILYATYVNFRLFSQFINCECAALKLYIRTVVEIYLAMLVFFYFYDAKYLSTSMTILYYFYLCIFATQLNLLILKICLIDKKVSFVYC